jgi:hypothetical protein
MRVQSFAALAVGLTLCVVASNARAQSARAPAKCTLEGERVNAGLEVKPEGAPSFKLGASGVRLLAVLGPRADEIDVDVRSPIFFRAKAKKLPYAFARGFSDVRGVARIGTDATPINVRVDAKNQVRGEINLSSEVQVRGLTLPCDALTLNPPPKAAEAAQELEADDGEMWSPRGQELSFRDGPGGAVVARLHVVHPDEVVLRRFADVDTHHASPWVRAEYLSGGSRLLGWVAREAITPMNHIHGHSESLDFFTGGCGRGFSSSPSVFHGVAQIKSSAVVFATEGKHAWGAFEAASEARVTHVKGAAWVRIDEIDNLSEPDQCRAVTHAFVARNLVDFPSNAGPRD